MQGSASWSEHSSHLANSLWNTLYMLKKCARQD